ncbi:MAG: 1,4-alpha-glucan branching protein GlgB [Acidimicrobiales bacterium]
MPRQHQRSEPALAPQDLYLFNEGRYFQAYERLGAHVDKSGDRTAFAVWAPNAESVSVIHDGNRWTPGVDVLQPQSSSGVWATEVSGVGPGTRYKFRIEPRAGRPRDKADPFAFAAECPPASASIVADLAYEWQDDQWMAERPRRQALTAPISIYEAHLGSWRRRPDGSSYSYRELAPLLADHLERHGFTHVELMPVMEHPYYGSWGYQTTGFFAPTARYGSPTDFMAFVDYLHQRGIGVILDWVPSHFATDEYALGEFDGTRLFEHEDHRHRTHPDWGSYEFNYSRHEVRSFLISSGWFWCDRYHADGLRVDAVASMLYLDYSRKPGGWVPNRYGGRENLEAVEFLRTLNDSVRARFPGVLTIAEESTAWPGVSRETADGGLGFSMKWERDPVYRSYHYGELTFRGLYAFTERFVLPLSHDEVVHGKGSLASKMPGDDWQRRANLRLLYSMQVFQPGKSLLFMGSEMGTWHEWSHESELEWSLMDHPDHAGLSRFVGDLNRCYQQLKSLHETDFDPSGFAWVIGDDSANEVLAWLRKGPAGNLLVVANCTPVPREGYVVGVPATGTWAELLNSDALEYGGSGVGNMGHVDALPVAAHGYNQSLELSLPPLGVLLLGDETAAGVGEHVAALGKGASWRERPAR